MYSMALGPRYFKWKMRSLFRPKALLFLHLLIALLTRSVVNVCAISKDSLFVFLVTNQVSLEEVCLPSFDVLNCWLKLVASCLDDENELPLQVIALFSATNSFNGSPQLGDICLLVQGLNKISPFFHFVCVDAVLDVIIQSWQFMRGEISFTEVSSSYIISLLVQVPRGVCVVGIWCDAALNRTVRKIFSSLWQPVGRDRLLKAASTSCLYLSQLSFYRLT